MKLGNIEIRALRQQDGPGAELYGSLIASLGALGTGMVVWDAQTSTVDWANKTAADLLGAPMDELSRLIPNLLDQASANGISITSPSKAPYDRTLGKPNGSKVVLEVVAKPWHGSKTILSFRDVTDRRQLEEFRDRFVVSAAHELRTPLTPVVGLIKLMRHSWANMSDAEREQAFDSLERQSERMLGLVTNMLDLSRLEHGNFQLELSPLQLRSVVDRAVELLPLLNGRQVRVSVPGDATAIANAFALEQILQNLLVNAYRYGGEDIRIELRAAPRGEIALAVCDDGPGIRDELVPRIFDAYARGAGRDGSGVGLGLTISRMFAEACGGSLSYQKHEQGACFLIKLPSAEPRR